jgi:hypothetical protein
MSVNLVPSWQVLQYSTNIQLLLQQKGSKLRSLLTMGNHVGKQASPVDQIGAVEATKVTTRFAPMNRVDAPLDRRWVFPVDYELPQLIDEFDKLRIITDPEGQYVQSAVYALGRKMDDEIVSAMWGTAKTGVDGSTSTTFDTTNQVVGVDTGGTASNLNVSKLRAARKKLMANQVDLDNDPIYCVVTSAEHDALLNEIQVINRDFNGADAPVLRDGRIDRFLGINFVHCERMTTGTDDQSGTSTQIPVFAKSGMYLGVWGDVATRVSQRNDLGGEPWQAYAKMTIGACRLEEKKIVKVWCR